MITNNFLLLFLMFFILTSTTSEVLSDSDPATGLSILKNDARLPTLMYDEKPLLAFGCHFEHMLFDDYDYKEWTQWMVDHGMNHCRARLYHAYYRDYSPFFKTEDGRYDLTKWDDSFWQRCREILSHLQENDIIVHLLIFPQGSGGYWWQGDGYYLPENNVHPETAFIRPKKSTAGFWKSWSRGKHRLYEIQTAILWKMIEETAHFDNIYYDLCHEPFVHAMDPNEQQDLKEFLTETTQRFVEHYQKFRPDKKPLMGLDTDFTPPGDTRNWIYSHDRFNLMIKGQNHEQFYTTAQEAIELVKIYRKPFCPQESLDPPGIVHIPNIKHKNSLTYFESDDRHHLRKYVWRWILARSQLIDIYQKSLRKDVPERERYNPHGHNEFEKDALIIRDFWNGLRDYPHLDFKGAVINGPGHVQMVLSSSREAVFYLSSKPGVENEQFEPSVVRLCELELDDGEYNTDIWKLSFPGGIVDTREISIENGAATLDIPAFTDDLVIHIIKN